MKLIPTLIIISFVAALFSGCVGKNDGIYSVTDVYENPGKFIDSKGVSQTIKIHGVAGSDPVYKVSDDYYYLASGNKDTPPNEIIYVSSVNGIPAPGSEVMVQGKIGKVIDAGKLRLVTFVPDTDSKK